VKVNIDKTTWSFSKLNTYRNCPYSWYDIYINKADRLQNAFSQYGILVHELLEKYALGKIDDKNEYFSTWELGLMLDELYDEYVTEKFPYNKYKDLSISYREQANSFFENIEENEVVAGIESEKYEILGVEHSFTFPIKDDKSDRVWDCRGFIDLVLRDKEDGKIIIVDHKSKSIKTNKKGEPNKKDIEDAYRQMSMYAIPIKELYGEYPKEIWINAFKIQTVFKREFLEEYAEEALSWALEIIHEIENDKEFFKTPDSFFCTQLCSCRETCGRFIIFDKNYNFFENQSKSMKEKIDLDKSLGIDVKDEAEPFDFDDDDEFNV
jgi:hypothetical protein